jgi:hypothetical protein
VAYPPPPTAPTGMTVPHDSATLVLAVFSTIAAVLVVAAVITWRRSGSPLLAAVLAGGLVTVALEPFADVLGLVWFPVDDQIHAFTTLGVPIPLFVVVGYLCFFGLVTWSLLRLMETGPSRRRFWGIAGVGLGAALLLEFPLLPTGVYTYYGPQPLKVLDYPLIWMTINSGACLVAALVIYRFRPFFSGGRAFATVALLPCADGAMMLATGWPAFTVMHTEAPQWAVNFSGLVTVGLGIGLYGLVAEVCCTDGRFHIPARAAGPAWVARWMAGRTPPAPAPAYETVA